MSSAPSEKIAEHDDFDHPFIGTDVAVNRPRQHVKNRDDNERRAKSAGGGK
jgi:hypothetical protein